MTVENSLSAVGSKRTIASQFSDDQIAAAVLALIVVALWIPVGFNVGGIIEEHLVRASYLRGKSPFVVGGQHLRPLLEVAYYIGYMLTPDSFVGLNLMHMIAIWAKAWFLYLILRRFELPVAISLATAVLFLIHPADDGQMTMRATNLQWSMAIFLLAVLAFIEGIRKQSVFIIAGMVISLVISVFQYEVTIPIALVVPLCLILVPEKQKNYRVTVVVWYVIIAALTARYIYIFLSSASSYQSNKLVGGGVTWIVESFGYLFNVYARSLGTGWYLGFNSASDAKLLDILLGAGVAIVACVAVNRRLDAALPWYRSRTTTAWWIIVGSFLLIGIGFSMYLPSTVRGENWRVLFYPSLGAAIVTGVALGWASSLFGRSSGKALFLLLFGVLTAAGFLRLSHEHRIYAKIAERQERVVDAIVAAVPELSKDTKLLLVLDGTSTVMTHSIFAFTRYLEAALYPKYRRKELAVQICYPYRYMRDETCSFDEDGVSYSRRASNPGGEVPYENVVAVRFEGNYQAEVLDSLPEWLTLGDSPATYNPRQLIDPGAAYVGGGGEVRINFGRYGGIGSGWSAPRKSGKKNYRFMSNDKAALYMTLPVSDYSISIKIANAITPELLASLGLTIDGEAIPLTKAKDGNIHGRIPARLISRDDDTVLIFSQDPELLAEIQAEKGPLIGVGFDWVRLKKSHPREDAPTGPE